MRSSPDGYQGLCKSCMIVSTRKWQQDNRKRYLAYQRKHASPLRAELIDYKESHPCTECGLYYPYFMMSFDHPPGADKVADISTLSTGGRLRGRERLWAEIGKCDLVCLNCHALRTHERWLLSKATRNLTVARIDHCADVVPDPVA
jgi:hypothetical protein